ncbi:efflux transporter, RND family, MFP subunit [Thioalkalivibrio sulfidiphilus HL-EbGr7]|uniref:Efflux transporter, RND family, MFP subunit n=1 Tax=Thioalkalivibrio sulfidiphilus (strain HL-EbGR7) TaxID=396588 RepID=B8GRW3_THISH|nr:efflux RND transporter periplasmic adaptor subunit [Thioalkalivibrio sulfidiphilus]ACL72667.1 efflux transporter, RND family, MFP subunit [Thioalkalivibrio sulfidiphilus HL-EbGr7]
MTSLNHWALGLCLLVFSGLLPAAEDLEFTLWQDGVEAFVEYPPLRVSEPARLITHLTLLDGNHPVREGELTLILERADGFEQYLTVDAPARTGIYLPELVPERPGIYTLTLHLEHPQAGVRRLWVEGIRVADESGRVPSDPGHGHDHGDEHGHEHPTAEPHGDHGHEHPQESAAAHGHDHGADDAHGHDHPHEDSGAQGDHGHAHDEESYITFLKEQQWRMAFSGEFVITQEIAPRLSMPAVVEAVPGRQAEVVAPMRGTLRAADGSAWVQPGMKVTAGQALAAITPLAGLEDIAQLEADLRAAEARLALARSELERVRVLVTDGVVSERRLREAQAEHDTALGAHEAAVTRFRGSRGTTPARGTSLSLRTPMDGVVVASHGAPGQVVEAGARIARVLDDRRVWVRVHVPAQDLALLETPHDLRIRRPGDRAWTTPVESILVYRGLELDQGALPLVYEVDNTTDPGSHLSVGLPLIASLATGAPQTRLTVPESAVLDDDGMAVVIVQHGGESFERRLVRLGTRATGRVAVLDGLEAGERVIVEGAYAVLLAGRETGEIGHGHAH